MVWAWAGVGSIQAIDQKLNDLVYTVTVERDADKVTSFKRSWWV